MINNFFCLVGGSSNQQVRRQSSCSDEVHSNNSNANMNVTNKGSVEAAVGKTNLLMSSNTSSASAINKSFYCPSRTNKVGPVINIFIREQ